MVGDDIARLVAALREVPFALRQISESDFAAGDADRARRVARDAFHALAPFDEPAWTPVRDAGMGDAPARASARLLVAFLAVVKYPPARDDAGALVRAFAPDAAVDGAAAVDALARAVRWVVEHRETCATRAHVAHHIADVTDDLPVAMRGAPEMTEALDARDRARRAYVAAHKKYERARRARVAVRDDANVEREETDTRRLSRTAVRDVPSAVALTRAVADLEDEKDSLTKKIEAVERKLDARLGARGDGRAVASLATSVRKDTRDESESRRAAASARGRAEAADARRCRAAACLRDVSRSLGGAESPLAALERARAETERARVAVAETLPALLRERRARERALAEASDEASLHEGALRDRAAEVITLTAAAEEDARFVEAKENERDGDDPAARQRASLAESVRAERDAALAARDRLAARVRRAEDAREALEATAGGTPGEAEGSDDAVGAGPTRASAAKASLAPRVAELRAARAAFASLERKVEVRRRAFDAAARAREGEHERLERETATETLRELDANAPNAGDSGMGLTPDQMDALLGARALIETRLRVTRDEAAKAGSGLDRDAAARGAADILSV